MVSRILQLFSLSARPRDYTYAPCTSRETIGNYQGQTEYANLPSTFYHYLSYAINEINDACTTWREKH